MARCSFPAGSIHGDFITLSFLTATPIAKSHTFSTGGGNWDSTNNEYGRLSWMHENRDDSLLSADEISGAGTDFYKGVGFKSPQKFMGSLIVNFEQYTDLCSYSDEQNNEPSTQILLYDHRTAFLEEGARSRARFDAPYVFQYQPSNGLYFWGKHSVKLFKPKKRTFDIRNNGEEVFYIDIELHERYPALGTAGDE